MKTYSYWIASVMLCSSLLPSCSPYAGAQKSVTAVGYGRKSIVISEARTRPRVEGLGLGVPVTPESAAVAVIAYLVKEADKAVTKARTGDYGATGQDVSRLSFAGDGYLLVLHTVKASPKLTKVATVGDFLSSSPGTAGQTLRTQMARESYAGTNAADAVRRLALQHQIDPRDHIALLVVCPVKRLPARDLPANAPAVYAVSLDGLYFPVLSAKRFKGESSNVVQRFAKENESMTLEVYGPAGYHYTTGTVVVPLAWFPPDKTGNAQWLSYKRVDEELKRHHNEAAKKQLAQILSTDTSAALTAHRAVVAPTASDHSLLRADAHVSETSNATGWIVKGIDKLGSMATSAVKK